eukprot:CAMPEP_0196761390 /NCGR_PEP_ID=MMETSP1095-20130614/609_1 /TAXON_ID=96789 ORGANISM="Chromulina nebulosa, Strain UTEXLB2642" /NCGR_SAMPLE_ID=MMETSP1095 /ASSEMBLY_ACC=CAM_ASM_000446 /LENGTH=826 /DNA_ID=CAMNT_0042110867 /DNA_START=24 /DNA_END=2505 /DNA_ORIENTATION=-
MSSKLSLSMSVPNLPGMVPSKDTWLYRQQDGFKKTTNPRPRTAITLNLASLGRFESGLLRLHNIDQNQDQRSGNKGNNYEESYVNNRPSTAGIVGYRGSQLQMLSGPAEEVPRTFAARSRPNTAEPVINRPSVGSRSNVSLLASFGLPKVEPPAPSRKQPLVPKFVENEKQVCRFYGYFYDERVWDDSTPLGVPTIERDMVRKLTIYYYLYDNTIHMAEPRAQNTGMTAGEFYKRGALYKADSQPVSLQDLCPGNKLYVLGREIILTDADQFTRDYFRRELNIILSPAFDTPSTIREDLGAMYATGLVSHFPDPNATHGSRSTDYLITKENNEKTYRFLRFDGRVLRFQCLEISALDTNIIQFNEKDEKKIIIPQKTKRYALSYFLSDQKVDIRVVKSKTNGATQTANQIVNLEESMLIMKKSKIAKNWRQVQRGAAPINYEPTDLQCGNIIDVYGREFLLINCDNFTRTIYAEMGITQNEVEVQIAEEKHVVHPIPVLGDGFLAIGSEIDTLANVYGTVKQGRDVNKINRNQNRILRSKAIMLSTNITDINRVFMITFYLEDDTIFIFEEIQRNSGIMGGTFLKRGRYINNLPDDNASPRYFIPTDIYLGNVISLNGIELKIVEMDNLSLKFCETYPDEFPMFDPFLICERLVNHGVGRNQNIRKIFSDYDNEKGGNGALSKSTILQILDLVGIRGHINEQEVLTLLRRIEDYTNLSQELVTNNLNTIPSSNLSTNSTTNNLSTQSVSNLIKSFGNLSESNTSYLYNELCDLFSYAYSVKDNQVDRSNKINLRNVDDLKSLLKLSDKDIRNGEEFYVVIIHHLTD